MTSAPVKTTYRELTKLADSLFRASSDDEEELASALDSVNPETRDELLASDLLNAYQVFFYYFREVPGDLGKERMLLSPASSLAHGVLISEIDYLRVVFRVENGEPVIVVSDDEELLANYRGKTAYRSAMQFIDDSL
jgi:hypothetical protein